MRRYKLRVIAKHNGGEPCYGITVPNDVAMRYKKTLFSIETDGENLKLISGAAITVTREDALNYKFPDERITETPINAK